MQKTTIFRYATTFIIAIVINFLLIAGMPFLLRFASPPRKDSNRDAVSLVGAIKLKPPPPRKKAVRKKRKPPPKVNPKIKNIMPKMDSAANLDVPFQFDMGLSQGDSDMGLSLGMKIWNEGDVDVRPVPLFRTRPIYPSKAMGKNVNGRVKFKFLIDKDGMVKSVEITEADPAGFFEEATINAVRQWRFQPAKVKGTPVSCWCRSSIKYELDFD